jgi:GH15 family glucan-1,4-alpha-glucosidase
MQHQANVYGELLDAMQLAAKAGIPRTSQAIEMATRTVEFIEACWGQPGAGLWESRAEQRHYVYSRAMAWAGVDRFLSVPQLREHAGQIASSAGTEHRWVAFAAVAGTLYALHRAAKRLGV